jgi:hypothetical protein
LEDKMQSDEDMFLLGSETARGGFRNEQDVVDKFNNWGRGSIGRYPFKGSKKRRRLLK